MELKGFVKGNLYQTCRISVAGEMIGRAEMLRH